MWEPRDYRVSPSIGFVHLGSVPFVVSIHIEVRLTEVPFLSIHLSTEMCLLVLSFCQLCRSKSTLIIYQEERSYHWRVLFSFFHFFLIQ